MKNTNQNNRILCPTSSPFPPLFLFLILPSSFSFFSLNTFHYTHHRVTGYHRFPQRITTIMVIIPMNRDQTILKDRFPSSVETKIRNLYGFWTRTCESISFTYSLTCNLRFDFFVFFYIETIQKNHHWFFITNRSHLVLVLFITISVVFPVSWFFTPLRRQGSRFTISTYTLPPCTK